MVPIQDAKILQFYNQISRSEQLLRNHFADDVYINYATTYHTKLFHTRTVLLLTFIFIYNFPKFISVKYFTALHSETLVFLVSLNAVLEYSATRRWKKPLDEFELASTIMLIKKEDGDRETYRPTYGEYNIRNLEMGFYFAWWI